MIYEAVMFDLDGTLVRTPIWYRRIVVNETLHGLKARAVSDRLVDEFWFGCDRNGTIRDYFRVEPEDFWPVYKTHDTPSGREIWTTPYNDVGPFMNYLKTEGFKTGVVTGTPQHIADVEVDIVGRHFFDAVVAAHHSNGYKHKPDPDGIEACMRMLEVPPENAIYIGNGLEDVVGAQKAKVLDVFLYRGEYMPRFDEVEPSETFVSLDDIRKKLIRL